MSKPHLPSALRLAAELEQGMARLDNQAAQRLRLQHSRIEADEALMRQALETLRYYASVCGEDDQPTPAKTAITALRARLETSK